MKLRTVLILHFIVVGKLRMAKNGEERDPLGPPPKRSRCVFCKAKPTNSAGPQLQLPGGRDQVETPVLDGRVSARRAASHDPT